MTTRTRQVPGNATSPVANGVDASVERTPHFSWEDWFRHASPQQRAAALGLAQQQGLLYPHQLPAITNGVKPAAGPAKDTELAQQLARLLAGKTDALPRLAIDEPAFFDPDLDDLQQQAVARALATPDLLMLHGLPGTGKSRVLTEIILQAAARGWRILFLAGQPASLDVILHHLVGRPEVFALRYLDTLEKIETLPAWLRGFTLDEQKQAFLERVLTGARGNHTQAESACRQRRAHEPLWTELHELARLCRDLESRLLALQEQLPGIAETVEREAQVGAGDAPFSTRLAELTQARDEALRDMESAQRTQQEGLAQAEKEADDLSVRIAEREPAYLAKKHGRFWTLAYWTNLFNGQIIQEMESLLEQQTRTQTRRQEIAQQIEQAAQQQKARHDQFQHDRAALLAGEIETRQQALHQQKRTIEEEARQFDAQWHALCQELDVHPAHKTPEAIAAAHDGWQQKKKLDEQRCQFAQQWTKFVEEGGASLAAKLPSFANVLAGTILRWHTDAKFRDAAPEPVDLLIVEDAETLTEADLLKLSRHAHRCVLVGQALAEPTPAPTVAEKASRALLPAPLVSAACWEKLWRTLGGDAGRWPCTWQREQGRLVCQLMPLCDDDRKHLENESLADAPDIELRILHRAHTRPGLAQVIFAPHCTFADAFRFMVREVQEFPLEPLGHTGWWTEHPERLHRRLGPNATRILGWLEIEPGLRLGSGAEEQESRVACIEFDKAAGWDRAKAEAWLQQHRPVCDQERTVFLQTPYRFRHRLAQIVQTVVRAPDWLTAIIPTPSADDATFEFIAVPALVKHDWPKEGAGLELDLTATRHADRLPVGLRQGLPARGFVNSFEAQALIRRLEAWQLKEATASCRVAVLAVYEGQVELLRRLVEQSEILRARTFPLEVALPSRWHQRECDVVFLSLTRSHSHRSAAFGEDVKELPLALTRARSRLFLFADPGSLCRRTSWHGPLDHLDAAAAHQERLRLTRLLAYLQKQGLAESANSQPNGRQ